MLKAYLHREDTTASIVAVSLFIAVFAGAWDVWWHGFLGRESFWSPPHLLLYLSVIIAIVTGLFAWRIHKKGLWKWLGLVLLLVPLSAPFDELWHRVFGVEETASVLVLWSPPHVALILSILVAFVLLLPLLRKYEDITKRRLFSALSLAGIFSLMSILVQPFEPLGPWHLVGFWGAGIMSFVVVVALSFSSQYLSGFGRATFVSFVLIVLTSIGFTEATNAAAIDFLPHAHAPGWLIILSLLLPAVFLDFRRAPQLWSAGCAGLISGGVLYGFSTFFIEPAFRYGFAEVAVVLIASFIGGLLAGVASSRLLATNMFKM